jgi:hypothetical protein
MSPFLAIRIWKLQRERKSENRSVSFGHTNSRRDMLSEKVATNFDLFFTSESGDEPTF